MLGSVPVKIEYSIKKGKYVVEESGLAKALNLLMRRRKIPKTSMPNVDTFAKRINAALGGNKKAIAQVDKLLTKLMK